MPVPKKTKTKPRVFKTMNTSEGKIKIRIDHKTWAEIYPHQDADEVRARILNRRIL